MSAYSVSSLSPSHSRQVLSAPCSRLVVVFPPLGPGSGSLGTWVDCIIQAPFLIKREPTEHSLWNLVIKLSFELFDRGQVIPETSGQGFREAVLRDADCLPYYGGARYGLGYRGPTGPALPVAKANSAVYLQHLLPLQGWSFARVGAASPADRVTFTPLAFSASTLVSEGCNTSSILWRKVHFCQIWEDPNVVGLTRAAI